MDVWKDLLPLRLHPNIGPELITFGVLWELAGGRQRRLDVTVKLLAEHFNRDGHSFRDQLEKLFALGCVHLLARDKRRGRFLINVLHPEFALPFDRTDKRQRTLPLEWAEGVRDIDEFIGRHPDLTVDAGAVIVPGGDLAGSQAQSPADGSNRIDTGEAQTPVHREPQTARSDEARTAFGRGIFPEPVAGKSPRGNPRGEIPATSRGNPRDETAPPQRTCVTGKSPSPPEAASRGNPRGEIPAPRASLKDSSKEEYSINVLMNNEPFNDSMFNEPNEDIPDEVERAETSRPAGDDREAQALERLLNRRRAALGQPVETPIEPVLAGINAVAQRFAPSAQKRRLEAELRRLVNDRTTGTWLYGFAADLLLVHGQSDHPHAGQIFAQMTALIQEFRNLRTVQEANGQKRYSLGARLNKVVHAICDAHGIATPYKLRVARQAAQIH